MSVIFHEVKTVLIFLAQLITTKIDLRCFEKLGPVNKYNGLSIQMFPMKKNSIWNTLKFGPKTHHD